MIPFELRGLVRDIRKLVNLHIRIAEQQIVDLNATTASFHLILGGQTMAEVTLLQVRVGEQGNVKVIPRKADGSIDNSVENVVATINGGATGDAFAGLTPYGNGSDPLAFTITGVASDPGDVPHVDSKLIVDFDSDTEGGTQTVHVELPLRIVAANATTATFEELPPA